MKIKSKVLSGTALIAALGLLGAAPGHADDELGGSRLTRFGAEVAGNADGSIPAYTGGLTQIPASYVSGKGQYPNPFKDERPLVRIDAGNMQEHEQFLSPGVQEMMRRYPSFYINVYPSHRTMVYSEDVLQNTVRNAQTARMVGDIEGDGVEGAYAGIPFPIPKNGYEVMWNFKLHARAPWTEWLCTNWLVRSSGNIGNLGTFRGTIMNSYYDLNADRLTDPYYFKYLSLGVAPASQVGYNIQLTNSINYTEAGNLAWVYTVGQRRVRTAPEFAYDTPAANFSGAVLYDEINMFSGRMDRFDFKLVGKQEMYVPYNVYRSADGEIPTKEEYLTKNHSNPEYQRYEKHRVWVVEANLKQGQRHIMPRRVFYIDEDSWIILLVDQYDREDKLYRLIFNYPFMAYDQQNPVMNYLPYEVYDLNKGYYMSTNNVMDRPSEYRFTFTDKMLRPSIFDPGQMAATGLR